MTNRRIPTRVVETGRVVRGSSGQGVGWLQSLAERARGLRAQLEGIHRRLSSPMIDGVPSAISGDLTFKANTQQQVTVQLPLDQTSDAPGSIISVLCNPILLSGQTYKIRMDFPPPGVFAAQFLTLSLEAGMTEVAGVNRPFIAPLNDYPQNNSTGGVLDGIGSAQYRYTTQQQVLGNVPLQMPLLPYFWNIIDEKSGRQYAQDWMPHGALMNTRGISVWLRNAPDSELFEFDTPWLFERDAQVSFLFRPIMDLYQVDASDAYLPYFDLDDRNQGRRNQQLTVRVEMHGVRYYDRQDVLKEGAYL